MTLAAVTSAEVFLPAGSEFARSGSLSWVGGLSAGGSQRCTHPPLVGYFVFLLMSRVQADNLRSANLCLLRPSCPGALETGSLICEHFRAFKAETGIHSRP